MPEAIVRVNGVHKFFTRGSEQIDVLNDLNLEVANGEFLALDLTRPHRLSGRRPLQHLDIRLLVHADEHFAPLPQALDSFVIPSKFASRVASWAKVILSMRVRGVCPNTEGAASPRAAAPAMAVVPPTNDRRDGANGAELLCR